jgi:hypothetical protein
MKPKLVEPGDDARAAERVSDGVFAKFGSLAVLAKPTLGALHAQAIWRHPRTPPVDIGVFRY